ncbi:hypothetical protein NL676_023512 [Syzygium grande]|nr:hypothetical protein NL676_023512 [Syzygium grande]
MDLVLLLMILLGNQTKRIARRLQVWTATTVLSSFIRPHTLSPRSFSSSTPASSSFMSSPPPLVPREGHYGGFCRRPWGRYVAETCDPRKKTRVWLNTFDTPKEAACSLRAFKAKANVRPPRHHHHASAR